MNGNLDILLKLWVWAQMKVTNKEINYDVLLVTDSEGITFLQVAAYKGNTNFLLKVWEWIEVKLNEEEK
jgi:hypothetical protein